MTDDQSKIIRYKAGSDVSFPMPSDEMIGMWRDLFRMKQDNYDPDFEGLSRLSAREERLFEVLTEKIEAHLSFVCVTTTEENPES